MTKPTFQEVRKQHNITLNMLIEDTQIDPSAVLLLDTWSIGEAGIIDTLLESLSRLSGSEYRRDLLNVGGFTFAAQPPYERVAAVAEESQWHHEGVRSGQHEGGRSGQDEAER
jgi:hypothetical protein